MSARNSLCCHFPRNSLLPLLAGGFLLGLVVGRWSALLVPVLFGVFVWWLWSADREVDAVEAGLLFGTIPTVGAVIGLLARMWVDSESPTERAHERLGRWLRFVIGLDPKAPEQPAIRASERRADPDDRQP